MNIYVEEREGPWCGGAENMVLVTVMGWEGE